MTIYLIAYQKTHVQALRCASRLNALHKGMQGLAATHDKGSSLLVRKMGVRIDAEAMINRGGDIGRADRVGGWISGGAVRGAVNVAASNSGPS